jgi:prolyl-tRNA synthetase
MFLSKTFIPTLKEAPQEAESISHQLMLRSGLIRMLVSGVYSFLPLGFLALENVEKIIRQEMNAAGACELLLPALQPLELWQKTGRDQVIGEVMFRFNDRRGRKLCLGPTHEEVITDLVKNQVSSYRQLPLLLYQIQTKFRDEIRPRFGLIRGCEFIMKDCYSFDTDQEGLDKNYAAMLKAYNKIFQRLGLSVIVQEADSGIMGGKVSHEFMVPAGSGEDVVLQCAGCGFAKPFKDEDSHALCARCGGALQKINTIEIGHIFQLGTKYSSVMEAHFLDSQGQLLPIIMGCYGIGVSRLLPTIIEQNHDKDGIIWPKEVAPYKVVILPLDATDSAMMQSANELYAALTLENIAVLLDDRDERAGVKFKDADLMGTPVQIIIGRESFKKNTVELKVRRDNAKSFCPPQEAVKRIKEML